MDYITSKRQKEILFLRRKLLGSGGDPVRVNATTLERLRDQEISPGRLAPVLVRRNHEDSYSAAYLLERITRRSFRLLVIGQDDWRIVRAKSTSHVIILDDKFMLQHSGLVQRQSELRSDIEKLVKKACPTIPPKVSTRRKSEKRTSRSSSRVKK